MDLTLLTPEFSSGGGIATYYQHLVPFLSQAGIRVRVIEGSAFHAGEVARREVAGCVVETLDKQRLLAVYDQFSALSATPLLRRHLSAAWAMWEQAQDGGDADLVEATDWGLLFAPAAILRSHPLVVQCHGSVGQIGSFDPMAGQEVDCALTQLVERALLGSFGQVQTPSRANAEFWKKEAGVNARPVLPAFSPGVPSCPLEPSETALVAGRLQKWKGPQILCEALEMLGADAPTIDWYGRDMPWDRGGLRTSAHLAANHGAVWNTRLRFHAERARDAVTALQARAQFNLVPSTWDVFNFTAVEALASGRPAVVSDAAGASELIVDGKNGYVFSASDAASLAEAIRKVLGVSAAKRREIGEAGLATVREALSPQKIAAHRMSLYAEAIREAGSAHPEPLDGWLRDICTPRSAVSPDAFLDAYSIRAMTLNILRRMRGKAAVMLGGPAD